jgi:hypothetical protein
MMEDRTCKCDVIKYLDLEIFEIIMLVVLTPTIIYMGVKIQESGKIWWKKGQESRGTAKEVEFQNRKAKYEAITYTTSKRGKVHVETFVWEEQQIANQDNHLKRIYMRKGTTTTRTIRRIS